MKSKSIAISPKRKPTNDTYQVEKDKSFRPMLLAILFFFIGLGTIISVYQITLLTLFTLTQFIVGFMVVGFLIPLKFYSKWFHFIKYETIIFNVIGVAPTLTGLFLVLNFFISVESKTEEFRIEKLYFEEGNRSRAKGVILEGNAYSDQPKIVEMEASDATKMYVNNHLRLTTAKGVFGFWVVKEKDFFNLIEDE